MADRSHGGPRKSNNPQSRDKRLVRALYDRDLIEFKKCLQEGANPNGVEETDMPLLHYAAIAGLTRFLPPLLEAGADIDRRLENNTALMWLAFLAVTPGQKRCASILIECGADLAAKGTIGTALDVAVSWRKADVARLLHEAHGPCKHATRIKLRALLSSGHSGERERRG